MHVDVYFINNCVPFCQFMFDEVSTETFLHNCMFVFTFSSLFPATVVSPIYNEPNTANQIVTIPIGHFMLNQLNVKNKTC